MTPLEKRNEQLCLKTAEALKKRNFDAYYCPTATEAVAKAISLIPQGDTVSWGGSASIRDMGLIQAVYAAGYSVIDRDKAPDQAAEAACRKNALFCDTYLTGTNALSADGQLVNIDGIGNRVAAICFGPKQVIVIAGINKIAPTLSDAMVRARNTAAPANAQRFEINTPCIQTGSCKDCLSPDCICASIVTTRFCKPKGRIKVIIAGEPLGY